MRRDQLLAAGVSRPIIDRRIRTGQLRTIHHCVYLVAGHDFTPAAAATAALLAAAGPAGLSSTGPLAAAVSHRTAAVLRGWLPPEPGPPHVIAARVCRDPTLHVHRMRLADDEVTRLCGLPATSPARTILDLAATVIWRDLEQALAAAERSHRRVRDDVASLLLRHPRHPGTRRLREYLRRLAESGTGPLFLRSVAEEKVLDAIRHARLPEPLANFRIAGFEVDFAWPDRRVIVEVDGFEWHGTAAAFQLDRRRDRALAAAGFQVLRVSWEQITNDRDAVQCEIAMALARGLVLAEAAALALGRPVE